MLLKAISWFFEVLTYCIIAEAIMSWFVRPGTTAFRIYEMLGVITEPIVNPFRSLTRNLAMRSGIDIAPLLAIVVLNLIRNIIFRMMLLNLV